MSDKPIERPAHRRSIIWDKPILEDVMELVNEGYSFRQIAEHLTTHGTAVSARALQQWYRKHIGRRRPAGANGTVPAARPTPGSGAIVPVPLASGRSMAELLAAAETPTRPKRHQPKAEPPGSILAALDKLTK